MSNACIIFVLHQTKKAHAHEHQDNTKKKDLMQSLWFYGIAPPPENAALSANAPYLPGFEKMFAKSMG